MVRQSGREGSWHTETTFKFSELDEDGTGNKFETDQAKTDTPTLLLDETIEPSTIVTAGLIKRIHYRLNPTNAVTYTLRIWAAALADNYASNLNMLYESPDAQADDEDYDRAELDIPFRLAAAGSLYYSIDWSGAPGNTPGFIEVSGIKYE